MSALIEQKTQRAAFLADGWFKNAVQLAEKSHLPEFKRDFSKARDALYHTYARAHVALINAHRNDSSLQITDERAERIVTEATKTYYGAEIVNNAFQKVRSEFTLD